MQRTALMYLAGIGMFLSKSQRGDRPRLRESHLGGKSILEFGQHQNATSGMVLRIPLPRIQPKERKGFPQDFFLTSSQFGRQCLHVSSGTCAADKNSGVNFSLPNLIGKTSKTKTDN